MKEELFRPIRLPFWLTLLAGVFCIALTIRFVMRNETPHWLYYIAIGLITGLSLGVGILMIERSRYFRQKHQHGSSFHYQTTSLAQYIVMFLSLLLVLANSREQVDYTLSLSAAIGTYLLTLSFVLFLLRKNVEIVVA